ncbi:MAG: hypothetical protein ACT4N2_02795 [Hyphomicrobium sp.]
MKSQFRQTIVAAVLSAGVFAGVPARAFDCEPTQCPDITTCAEAYYKLEICGDVDVVPCNSLCRGP